MSFSFLFFFLFAGQFVTFYIKRSAFGHMTSVNFAFFACAHRSYHILCFKAFSIYILHRMYVSYIVCVISLLVVLCCLFVIYFIFLSFHRL